MEVISIVLTWSSENNPCAEIVNNAIVKTICQYAGARAIIVRQSVLCTRIDAYPGVSRKVAASHG